MDAASAFKASMQGLHKKKKKILQGIKAGHATCSQAQRDHSASLLAAAAFLLKTLTLKLSHRMLDSCTRVII